MLRLLFVGDISGNSGRRAVSKLLRALRSRLNIDFIVANGENAAGGLGITRPTALELLNAGADVITLGNHTFAKRDVAAYLDEEPRVIRPANYPPGVSGRGWGIFRTPGGENIGVISLLGRTFMTPVDCPFRTADKVISEMNSECKMIIVDVHAEATSEKIALGWYLNGRASAVFGTHTHVQTSDERVLSCGTAYITDVGMTGVHDSVLGLETNSVISRFMTSVPSKFTLAEGKAALNGVVVEIDPATGRSISIQRIRYDEDEL